MKSFLVHFFSLVLCCALPGFVQATNKTQTIRGQVVDKFSKSPIVGAEVQLLTFTPIRRTITDEDGRFRFEEVTLGRHKMEISHEDYESMLVGGLELVGGAEINLVIKLEERVKQAVNLGNTALITAAKVQRTGKDQSSNPYNLAASRLFSVDEANRFAGDRNDPNRLISNYAGIMVRDDHYNHLSVRGNSPMNMQYRLEGVFGLSPNHLGAFLSNGGQAGVLTPYILDNSDFMLGAAPAEYGGALGGVFDMRLRAGNDERFQFLGQLSTINGIQVVLEGPLSKSKRGSFLLALRHTPRTFTFMRYGMEYLMSAGQSVRQVNSYPRLSDFVLNMRFPKTQIGEFSLVTIAGVGTQNLVGTDSSLVAQDQFLRLGVDNTRLDGFLLLKLGHQVELNRSKTLSWQNALGLHTNSTANFSYSTSPSPVLLDSISGVKGTVFYNTFVNYKQSAKLNLRIGTNFNYDGLSYDEIFLSPSLPGQPLNYRVDDSLFRFGLHLQNYAQALYRPSNSLSLSAGAMLQYYFINEAFSLEPRLQLRWTPEAQHSFYLAYANTGQILPPQILAHLIYHSNAAGQIQVSNPYKNLGFMKSHNGNFGYVWSPAQDWRVRFEGYYQWLYRIPTDTSLGQRLSVLDYSNAQWEVESDHLVAIGQGRNYGLEFTVEKFFAQNYYFILATGIGYAQQKGADGLFHSTAFDTRFSGNVLVGREFSFGPEKRHRFTIDLKSIYNSGHRQLPLDEAASRQAGTEVYEFSQGFSEVTPFYWRVDLKFGLAFTPKNSKTSHRLYFDFLNVTNRVNREYLYFDPVENNFRHFQNFPLYLDFSYQFRF